ncbi:MAG TPA: DUF5615 family PIN-like protein [Solirubrobacteraceae bacterium]|nr:DUF5615 family PIN-like protein [Solirubrobacteraceae bacterium]
MRLLLDEMWTPTIALETRKRGFDVIAISEPAHASRYAGINDDEVFARAQEDERVIVTDNIADYEQARRDWEDRGQPHHGLLYALNPPFNRHRGERVIGQMVNALAHFLSSPDAAQQPLNRAHFLREAPGDG